MKRPLLVLIGLAASSTMAFAKPKVIVTKIDGDASGDVFTAVTEALDPDLSLVSQKEVNKQVDKLNLSDDLTDKEVGKLEKALNAEALIRGTLDKKGETMALHLKVYLKAQPKPKAFTVKFSNSTSEKFRKSLHDTILDKIGAAAEEPAATEEETPKPKKPKKAKKPEATEEEAATEEETPKPKKPKKAKKPEATEEEAATEEETPKPKKPKKKKAAASEEEEEAPAGETDEVVTVAAPTRMASRDAVRVDAGISVTGRSLSFASRAYDQAPKPFKNNPVPGAHVEAEMYPFAFANPKSPAAGLGFAFEYDKTLSLTLRTTAADGTAVQAPANQQRYSVAAVYRIPFGSSVTSPSVTLGIGYGQRTFIVNRGGLMDPNSIDIPDVNYTAVLPQARARIPFTSSISLDGGADFMLVTDAGAIEKQDQYGQGKVTGLEVWAGLDFLLGNRFVIRVSGEFAQMGFVFVGNGAMAVNRDGDASTKDVGGAADRYFGGAITLGVLY